MSLGDALLARYLEDEGRYPESIGIVLWATCTMRTRGDDVAEILHLMGLRPVWQKATGRVTGIEVVPLSELGRPRIDVTVRISGLFRDAFPNLVNLLDRAVEMVADLEESPEDNYLAGHVVAEIEAKIAEGLDSQLARQEALYRLFGDKPGAYGPGSATSSTRRTGRTTTTWARSMRCGAATPTGGKRTECLFRMCSKRG